jgi:sugar phosphate isomerase/epimerase
MKMSGIGINVDDRTVDGRLSVLESYLRYVQDIAYDVGEVSIPGLDVVINGRLNPDRLKAVQQILTRFHLRYSVHAPGRANLAFGANRDLDFQVLEASLRFCNAIGARILVYHSGLQALDMARTGTAALPDADELARGREREIDGLRRLTPIASDLGVIIAVENLDPHLWEYGVLIRGGKRAEDLSAYHSRLLVPRIVEILQAVDHPNVGMTLDLAHLYLATQVLRVDYLDAIRQAAPWVRHIHVNDNFGRLDTGRDWEGERLPYGEGDLHLPPGWGAIPLREAFALLPNFAGDVVLELKTRYWEHFSEALVNLRSLLSTESP